MGRSARAGWAGVGLAVLGAGWLGTGAEAKTFRYSGGPAPTADTALAIAVPELELVTRTRGPRVPLTNLQLATIVARAAFETGLKDAPLDGVPRVVLNPASDHPLNFVAEHAVLRQLARRGVEAVVRRQPGAADTALAPAADDPVLEYEVATARVTYIRLRGWLPGRVKIERQGLVEARLALREPRTGIVRWTGDATHNLVDAFPRTQVALVEDPRHAELQGKVPGRSVDRVVEPLIVVAIVGGLVALFFQNRP